jgi:hypothetical protein
VIWFRNWNSKNKISFLLSFKLGWCKICIACFEMMHRDLGNHPTRDNSCDGERGSITVSKNTMDSHVTYHINPDDGNCIFQNIG